MGSIAGDKLIHVGRGGDIVGFFFSLDVAIDAGVVQGCTVGKPNVVYLVTSAVCVL